MKRFPGSRTTLFVAGLAVAAAAAAADQNAPGGPHGGMMAWGHHQMEKCLSDLDLSDAQKAAIDEARAAGKATLKADGEAMKAIHQKMQADLAAGADKSVLGQNAIDQDAAFLRFIEGHHLKPGQTIEVEARDEVSDSVRLKGHNDQRMTIGARAASKLLVSS